MEFRDRVSDFVKALPVAQKVGIVSAVLAVAMLGIWFMSWVTTPSYTVLYSGLEQGAVADAIDELETLGVPYKLEGGGTTVLVPQEQLYGVRAQMAGAGFAGEAVPEGYEILDGQGLTVSDFRQRVDYQRALEGEMAKTLMAMDGIESATVHLVIPEEELFTEDATPVTASVLVRPTRPLDAGEVETIAFLVSSSVEGLAVDSVTIADTEGTVLHAPGSTGGASVATNRNMRQTREFEEALAADIGQLLGTVTAGTAPSVVVRATLNFDESETATETYDPESQVTIKESTTSETFDGTGAVPGGGVVGVDGGPLDAGEASESQYDRDEALREFGVDTTTQRTVVAPGTVERLSVAIVMDDGTTTGITVPPQQEIETLVTAAVGLEPARGDTIAVQKIAYPAPEEDEPEVAQPPALLERLPQLIAALVLLIVVVALFLMTRRRRRDEVELAHGPVIELATPDFEEAPADDRVPAMSGALGAPAADGLKREVTSLVSNQPDEIAMLLRGWLADRRGTP